MNDIRPFWGLRFDEAKVGPLGEVVCPPYDIISPAEQIALHGKNPHNLVRLEWGLEFPEDNATSNRYTRAAETLDRWIREGSLKLEDEPAVYLYEQQFEHEGRTLARRGVLADTRLTPWEERVVLPHENTLAKPKEDRLQLMRATSCNFSPLFLLFDDPTGVAPQLMAVFAETPADLTADTGDGQLHRVWILRDERNRRLLSLLQRSQLYIADGHHRYETELAYRDERRAADPNPSEGAPYNFGLMLLVDAKDPALLLLALHRTVKGVAPAALEALESDVEANFDLEQVAVDGLDPDAIARVLLERVRELGQDGHAVGVYRSGRASVLRLRQPDGFERQDRPLLDVDVLHDLVLAPSLGVGAQELKSGEYVEYTRDAREAIEAVAAGRAQVAFLLNPTRVEQVLETARSGGKMPQKSTYFYPKPTSGLVINRM